MDETKLMVWLTWVLLAMAVMVVMLNPNTCHHTRGEQGVLIPHAVRLLSSIGRQERPGPGGYVRQQLHLLGRSLGWKAPARFMKGWRCHGLKSRHCTHRT